MFRMVLVAFSLSVSLAAAPVAAQDKPPTTKKISVELRKLNPKLRKTIIAQLREMGIEPADGMTLNASTDNCPTNCNDSVGGGFCYCSPDSSGKCPSGTEKGGTPEDPYCKVKLPKGNVAGGGLSEPAQVLMP